jgi:hypothetical protein
MQFSVRGVPRGSGSVPSLRLPRSAPPNLGVSNGVGPACARSCARRAGGTPAQSTPPPHTHRPARRAGGTPAQARPRPHRHGHARTRLGLTRAVPARSPHRLVVRPTPIAAHGRIPASGFVSQPVLTSTCAPLRFARNTRQQPGQAGRAAERGGRWLAAIAGTATPNAGASTEPSRTGPRLEPALGRVVAGRRPHCCRAARRLRPAAAKPSRRIEVSCPWQAIALVLPR